MIKSEVIRLRADPRQVAAWHRRARKNGMTLSEYIRLAAGAAAADILFGTALKDELLKVRSALNLAMHVRTADMKNLRIEDALAIINDVLEAM